MAEEKLTVPLKEVYSYLKTRPCEYVSTTEIAEALKISYAAAYYRARRLAELGYIAEHVTWMTAYVRGRRVTYRRRWFHYLVEFYKSHTIISMDYAEEHLFECHVIFPHLKKEITEEDEETLLTLAFELMAEYGLPTRLLTHPNTTFNLGEVQTKPAAKFNEQTEASIFDVKRTGAPVRRSYRIRWKHEKAWTETTLTGERIEHPAKISYTKIEEIGKIGREELKKKWKELAEKEAIQ